MHQMKSPGILRALDNCTWNWNFSITNVRSGFEAVTSDERAEARKNGAKLTFGEVLECGVTQLLDHLNIKNKSIFHDLGCGPGKLLIQTYLMYNNLKKCLGIELAPGRYNLAEKNIKQLVKSGFNGRTFTIVEYNPGNYIKIIENIKDIQKNINIGDKIQTFNNIHEQYNKNNVGDNNVNIGIVTSISEDYYEIEYDHNNKKNNKHHHQNNNYNDDNITTRVDKNNVYLYDKIRIIEIVCGSIFDYANAWNCDVCILETDFPEEVHQNLINGMVKTPEGCIFLTYHDLKKFTIFPHNDIKQLNINVYDNNRYPTTWSQGWRFFLWEHIINTRRTIKYGDFHLLNNIKYLVIQNTKETKLIKIKKINHKKKFFTCIDHHNKINKNNKEKIYKLTNNNIYSPGFTFDLGDEICAYWPYNVSTQFQNQYELFFGIIKDINMNGYTIEYQDGDIVNNIDACLIFNRPSYLFKIGDTVQACWPMNAQNKNCPERYVRFPGIIIAYNADGTYCVKYNSGLCASNVREMWMQKHNTTNKSNLNRNTQDNKEEEDILGCGSFPPDPSKAIFWDVETVCRWIDLLGLKCSHEFRDHNIDGKILLDMDRDILINDIQLQKKEAQLLANKIYRLKNPTSSEGIKLRLVHTTTSKTTK